MPSTVRLFEFTLNSTDWNKYQVEGRHQYALPALSCDVCGSTWKTTGEAYPGVQVESHIAELLSSRRTLGVDEFAALRERLAPSVPPGARLSPGAALGQFQGSARGRFPDVVWNERWTMFLQSETASGLKDHGVRLPRLSGPKLHFTGKGSPPELLEPEAVPLVDLSQEGLASPMQPVCARCDRQPGSFREFLVDAQLDLPHDVDLFRARNNSAVYLVTERFADAARALELTGCVLNELRVADRTP